MHPHIPKMPQRQMPQNALKVLKCLKISAVKKYSQHGANTTMLYYNDGIGQTISGLRELSFAFH